MTIQELFEQLRELTPSERQEIRKLLDMLDAHPSESGTWSDEELAEALKVTPQTGAEIADSDSVGAWAHHDIEDGAAWVNQQREKRRRNRQ